MRTISRADRATRSEERFAVNTSSPDTNTNTNKTDRCSEHTEFGTRSNSASLRAFFQ